MNDSRRTFCAASLPALLTVLAAREALAAPAPTLDSFALPFAQMKEQGHGPSTFRAITNGVTASGEHIEIHETELQPGASPHPAHRHKHEEFMLIVKGNLEVTIDGTSTVLNSGSAAFMKSNSLHHVRNAGQDIVQYFVVGTGMDA